MLDIKSWVLILEQSNFLAIIMHSQSIIWAHVSSGGNAFGGDWFESQPGDTTLAEDSHAFAQSLQINGKHYLVILGNFKFIVYFP